jgi:hypothetical protein
VGGSAPVTDQQGRALAAGTSNLSWLSGGALDDHCYTVAGTIVHPLPTWKMPSATENGAVQVGDR